MKNKTIKIEGAEFELVPVDYKTHGTNHVELTPGAYALKPISPKVTKKTWKYSLDFISQNKLPADFLIEENYNLTPTQAQAVADALNSLLEFIMHAPGTYDSWWNEVPIAKTASRAIRKGQS